MRAAAVRGKVADERIGQAMSQGRKDELAEAAVKTAVHDALADVDIESIEVRPTEDHAGEPALSIIVHIRAAQRRLSGSRLLDTIEAASTALRDIDDGRFPYVTFLAPDYEQSEDARPAA